MKILMRENTVGCNDGIRSAEYKKGETYEVSNDLAKCFLDMKVADLVTDEPVKEKAKEGHENKAVTEYENKASKPKANKGDSE